MPKDKMNNNIKKEIIEMMVGVFYMVVISMMAGVIGWLLAAIYLKPNLC